MKIKIEKGVKPPSKAKYLPTTDEELDQIRTMEVGDTFVVDMQAKNAGVYWGSRFRRVGYQCVAVQEGDGARVWRVSSRVAAKDGDWHTALLPQTDQTRRKSG